MTGITGLNKILLLFFFLIANTATASETSLTLQNNPPDSCDCPCGLIGYTDVQDKRCLECLQNRPKLDSNLVDCDSTNLALTNKLKIKNEKLTVCTDIATRQEATITSLEKKNKWLKIAIGAITGIAILEGILILVK